MAGSVNQRAPAGRASNCRPRGVYTDHLDEFKHLMTKGVGLGKPQPPQTYNQGACKFR